jgi:hypothetical protein
MIFGREEEEGEMKSLKGGIKMKVKKEVVARSWKLEGER